MKKVLSLLILLTAVMFLFGCAEKSTELVEEESEKGSAIAGQAVKINYLSCSDSDGGKNTEVLGEVDYSLKYSNNPTKINTGKLKDKCASGTTNKVMEYYCSPAKNAVYLLMTCADGKVCKNGVCLTQSTCTPSCIGKTCGDDGCGGSCGICVAGTNCQNGACVSVKNNS